MSDEKPNCKVVLANNIAKSLLDEVHAGLKKIDRKPLLVGFLASADPAAKVYADWTGKTCEDKCATLLSSILHSTVRSLVYYNACLPIHSGFHFELRTLDREDLEDAILDANTDNRVDGIIVYYPIFSSRQDQYIQQLVSLQKDVEGLSHRYIFNMYQNIRFLDPEKQEKKSILPCTPLAVIKILEYLRIYNTILPYGNRLYGRTVTVINRSEVVGRPLAALLANDGACVYSVDIADVQQFHRGEGLRKRRHEVVEKPGWTLHDCLPLSDVVISGVPGDKYKVPVELLREGAVCINFSSERNFDSAKVKEKASIYVPAIGKVTIVVLLRNLLVCVR